MISVEYNSSTPLTLNGVDDDTGSLSRYYYPIIYMDRLYEHQVQSTVSVTVESLKTAFYERVGCKSSLPSLEVHSRGLRDDIGDEKWICGADSKLV